MFFIFYLLFFFYKLIYIIKELSIHFVYPVLKKRLFNLIYKGNPIRNDLYHKKKFFFLLFTIIHERYFKDLEIDLTFLYLSFFLKKNILIFILEIYFNLEKKFEFIIKKVLNLSKVQFQFPKKKKRIAILFSNKIFFHFVYFFERGLFFFFCEKGFFSFAFKKTIL